MRVDARPLRAILTVAALASTLATAACVTTEPSPPAAAAAPGLPEPAPSAYVSMLRSQGVETTIPSRGKFILVNIPSYELVALQETLARAQHRASEALATVHLPQMPTREELLAGARAMFAKTPSIEDIVDRAHDMLLAAVGARLAATAAP